MKIVEQCLYKHFTLHLLQIYNNLVIVVFLLVDLIGVAALLLTFTLHCR